MRFALLLLVGLPCCACSSESADAESGSAGSSGTGAAGGAAGQAGAPGGDLLPVPDDGIQVTLDGASIAAGDDIEQCDIGAFPGEPGSTYYTNHVELAMAKGSHHIHLRSIEAGSVADGNADVGERAKCDGNGEQPFGSGLDQIIGSQSPYSEAKYPDGVGLSFVGGQKYLWDYHYVNAGKATVDAHAAANLHLVEAQSVRRIAQRFAYYNLTIDTPAHSQAGFEMECKMTQDVEVASLTRHTHRWGTTFTVWYTGGARDGTQVFSSDDWEHDTTHAFAPPDVLHAGEGFRFRCEFDNTEDRALRFGSMTSDEMCILYGSWWVAAEGDTPGVQDCVGQTVGTDGVVHGTHFDPTG